MPTAKKAAKAAAAPGQTGTGRKATAKRPSASGEPAKKASVAKQAPATKKAPAAKQASAKSPAKKTTPAKKASVTRSASTSTDEPTREATARRTAEPVSEVPPSRTPATKPSQFPVRDGEDAWTKAELDEVREDLKLEIVKHRRSIELAEAELRELLADGSDGAGRDAADVGSANFERDQEMSLAAGAREMLLQSEHALRLIDQGLYGWCENCGQPIGKGRLQVYPRAIMCVTCKQRHERR